MHKLITIAAALAVGTMWSLSPASAQTTTDRMERKAERAADKAERAADKAADRVEDKTKSTTETIKDKAEDAKDTVKDKAVRAKDKMKETFAHTKDKMRSADGRVAMADTRAAQGALKTQGFDPGPIDGRMGPRTSAALTDYQRKNDLPVTGMLDDATMAKLEVRSTRSTDTPAASPANRPDPKKQSQ